MAIVGWIVVGSIFAATVVFALIVAFSVKKIDFGERIFKITDRKTLIPRGPLREKALAGMSRPSPQPASIPPPPPSEAEAVYSEKRKSKKEKSSKKMEDTDIESSFDDDFESIERREKARIEVSDGFEGDALTGPDPGTGFAPKFDDEEVSAELKGEMEEAEEAEVIEAVEVIGALDVDGHSRDLSIKLPKNMCLDEVFRLKVTLIKSEEFKEELTIKELELDKKEAEYFSLSVTKLGETVTEATTRILGLEEGSLIVRPIAIGNVAVVSPGQRTVFFDPESQEIVVEFFLTPTKWSKDLVSNLRIEFEQELKVIKTVNVPIKIYKRKLEAIFGFNLSKWHQYTLFIYSGIGALVSFLSFLTIKMPNWVDYIF